MRVLHILQTLSPRFGGPTVVGQEMCKFLAKRQVKATIFTTNRDHPPSTVMDVPVEELVQQDGYFVRYFPVEFGPMLVSSSMARALRGEVPRCDLVHIHGLYRFPQAIAAHYARRFNVPYIVQPHGALDPVLYYKRERRNTKRIYERLVEFRNLNHAAALQYTARDEMDRVSFLNLKSRAVIIPNGLDSEKYRTLPRPGLFRVKHGIENKRIILHLGRITFKKGLDILVMAFAKLVKKFGDVMLVLAGPDNEGFERKVDGWLREAGVRDRAIFTGMLLGEEKLQALGDADIFALPSYAENFGMAVLEAMASGLPVVVSNRVNIWRELERSGAALVTPCEIAQVADALMRLLENPGLRAKMGDAGLRLVDNKYSWDVVIDDLLSTYKCVI